MNKSLALVLVAFGCLTLSSLQPVAAQKQVAKKEYASARPKWEYKVATHSQLTAKMQLNEKLDELGKERWELATVQTTQTGATGGAAGIVRESNYIFKRPWFSTEGDEGK